MEVNEFVEGKDGVMAIGFCVEGIKISEEVKEGGKAIQNASWMLSVTCNTNITTGGRLQ
jgi:hypothetical protein